MVCGLACAPPRPANLADAVLPYSYDMERGEASQSPFVAQFQKGGRRLFFVAADHGCDPKTFGLVDGVFATHPVSVAMIEGYPAGRGMNPQSFASNLEKWRATGFCQGGEPAYTAFEATVHGASFIGGEPDERAVAQALMLRGFTAEDVLGFYFVRQVPTFQRDGTLAEKGLDASFSMLTLIKGKQAGLEGASASFSLDRFREWYAKQQGKPFDLETMDSEEAAPIVGGKYVTQRISAITGEVRDRFIVEQVASLLATHKDVLVVYGHSHFPTLRPALELLMGRPVAPSVRAK
jgi:hypothetical protein